LEKLMKVGLAQQISDRAVPSNPVVYGRDLEGKGIPIDEEGVAGAIKLFSSYNDANMARVEGAERASGSIRAMLEGIDWLHNTIRRLPANAPSNERALWNEELTGQQNQLTDLQTEIQAGKALAEKLPKIQEALRAQISKYSGILLDQLEARLAGTGLNITA
jgi:hypothetical protein